MLKRPGEARGSGAPLRLEACLGFAGGLGFGVRGGGGWLGGLVADMCQTLTLGAAASCPAQYAQTSATGTRTRVARVRAEYPSQLDYSGV